MKELVELIVKALVDKPEEVRISETEGESIVILEIRVAPEDVGKVIGREGRIANAIRTIVKASGSKQGKKVTVEIVTQSSQSSDDRSYKEFSAYKEGGPNLPNSPKVI